MKPENYNCHLSLNQRYIIENKVFLGESRRSIAILLEKDPSTICKEVKNRRYIENKNYRGNGIRDCIYIDECEYAENKYCPKKCEFYIMSKCKRRDRTVGVCNGCDSKSKCRKTKFFYNARKAHFNYQKTLSESREGSDLSYEDAKKLAAKIKPLLDNGQSVYAIKVICPEIKQSEKTLYTYINTGILKEFGIDSFSSRRIVTMKQRVKNNYKKRKDNKYLVNRKYDDFLAYIEENSSVSIVEMDTVYNDISNGPFIQTFYFRDLKILYGIYHESKTSSDMVSGLNEIKVLLGEELFNKLFQVLLTDRGSEFICADNFEEIGPKIFYCDPMASYQKSFLENVHGPLRFILPKGEVCKDLKAIGLFNQNDLNLAISHVNSYALKIFAGNSRLDYFEINKPDIYNEVIKKLNIQYIDKAEVIMSPNLLKRRMK